MVQGPVTNRRFSRRQIRQAVLIGVGVVLAAVLGGGGWFAYRTAVKSATDEAMAARQSQAEALAQRVIDPLNEITSGLLVLGKSPDILVLFEQRDAAGLAAAAATHAADFPSALRLRFLLPGAYGLEPDAKPPLGFASLDMLGQAERSSGPVAAEVHGFGTPDQHIVVIRRVKNKADQLVGLMHLSLDVAVLDSILSKLDVGKGYVELQQAAGGKAIVLAKAGPGSSGEPVIVSVPSTRWNLAYWAVGEAPAGAGFAINWVMVGGVLLAVVLVSAGVVFWMQRPAVTIAGEEPRSSKSDVIYAGAVKAIMDGVHPGMEHLVPNLPKSGMKGPVMPVSQGMTGDDITMIVRKDDLKAGAKPPAKPAAKSPPKPVPGAAASEAPTDPPQKKSP